MWQPCAVLHGELSELEAADARALVATQVATGGMAVKLQARGSGAGSGRDACARRLAGHDERCNGRDHDPAGRGAGMTTTSIDQAVMPALLPVYKPLDVEIVSGHGAYLVAEDGRELLDFTSGIGVNALGYGDAETAAVLQSALASGVIHTSNIFRTRPAQLLAERLVALSIADRVFFCNSGGEANEGALKFARRCARAQVGAEKHEIVALKGSFHGRLFGTMAVTDRPAFRDQFQPVMPGVRFVTPGNIEELNSAVSSASAPQPSSPSRYRVKAAFVR